MAQQIDTRTARVTSALGKNSWYTGAVCRTQCPVSPSVSSGPWHGRLSGRAFQSGHPFCSGTFPSRAALAELRGAEGDAATDRPLGEDKDSLNQV